jgi:hypothetical protein
MAITVVLLAARNYEAAKRRAPFYQLPLLCFTLRTLSASEIRFPSFGAGDLVVSARVLTHG